MKKTIQKMAWMKKLIQIQLFKQNKFFNTRKRVVFMSILLLSLVSLTSWSESKPRSFQEQIEFPVEKFKLKNGLTVILYNDHSSPLVTTQLAFRVGSKHEPKGKTGMAHFFEHLMFRGSKKYSAEDFEAVVSKNGGRYNAYTSHDLTNYYETMPSGNLDIILKINADRMRNLIFNKKMIKKEREVVKEEKRYRRESSVSNHLIQILFETIYKDHHYGWTVIGSLEDLNTTRIKDLKKFYNTFYAPNNAVLVIAGDFKSSKAKKLINNYFAPISPQKLPLPPQNKEVKFIGPKRIVIKKNINSTTFVYGYLGPKANTKDSFALDLLSSILSDGNSSRIYQSLVYKSRLATSAVTGSYSLQDSGLFIVAVEMKPKTSMKKAEALLQKELDKIKTTLVSKKELQKAKNQLMSYYISSLKTILGKADSLVRHETMFKDHSYLFKSVDKYLQVTREDILHVAQKYLQAKRLAITVAVPKNKEKTPLRKERKPQKIKEPTKKGKS